MPALRLLSCESRAPRVHTHTRLEFPPHVLRLGGPLPVVRRAPAVRGVVRQVDICAVLQVPGCRGATGRETTPPRRVRACVRVLLAGGGTTRVRGAVRSASHRAEIARDSERSEGRAEAGCSREGSQACWRRCGLQPTLQLLSAGRT